MRTIAHGSRWFWPRGKRRRLSHTVGLSIKNQASGGEMVGPHPVRWCLPYGAARKRREMMVGGVMKKRVRRL